MSSNYKRLNDISSTDASSSPPTPPLPPQQLQQQQRHNHSSKVVYLFVMLYIFFNVVASVNRKLMYDAFGSKYQFFRLQLTNLLYNCYATVVVLYRVFISGEITARMRSYPLYKFVGIAFLDGFGDFFTSVGGINTPGDWQVLISQLVIPITMVLAFLVLSQRYTNLEITGATVIIFGLVLALVPLFTGHTQSQGDSPKIQWYSIIIFITAQIPKSASGVYKESVFKEVVLDIFWLSAIVSWTQLALTWVFLPLQSLKAFGGVSLHEIPQVFRDGFQCFLGDSSIPVYNNSNEITGYCGSHVPRVTMFFSVSGFFSGISQLLIYKYDSAVLSVMASAIALPIANIVFSIHFFMGDQTEAFSFYDLGGLVLVLCGFILYRWRELFQTTKKNTIIYDEDASSSSVSIAVTTECYQE